MNRFLIAAATTPFVTPPAALAEQGESRERGKAERPKPKFFLRSWSRRIIPAS